MLVRRDFVVHDSDDLAQDVIVKLLLACERILAGEHPNIAGYVHEAQESYDRCIPEHGKRPSLAILILSYLVCRVEFEPDERIGSARSTPKAIAEFDHPGNNRSSP